MINATTKKLVLSALFAAMGVVLPAAFHMVPSFGPRFLPMHLPVLLCAFLCGGPYGALCAVIIIVLSSLLTGMPPIFPTGISMMFEMGTYALLGGFLYKNKKISIWLSLICAMLAGRAVSGAANAVLLGLAGKAYTLSAFLASSFVTALPGIIIQLVLIPAIILFLEKQKRLNV